MVENTRCSILKWSLILIRSICPYWMYIGWQNSFSTISAAGIFINRSRRQTRPDLQWPDKPVRFVYRSPFLLCFTDSAGIFAYKITEHSCSLVQVLPLRSSKPLDRHGCIVTASIESVQTLDLMYIHLNSSIDDKISIGKYIDKTSSSNFSLFKFLVSYF